jgi:8-oxo-dGTP diphosphatase
MAERYTVTARTLIFLLNGSDVLLIQRSPEARLFPGLCNGVGGHLEPGEDVLASARREVREETGLDVGGLSLRCVLHTAEAPPGEHQPGVLVFIFVGRTEQREVTSSPEGELRWVALDRLHTVHLLPDLRELLPRVLALPPDAAPLFLVRD